MQSHFFAINLEKDKHRLISLHSQFDGRESSHLHIVKAIDAKTDPVVKQALMEYQKDFFLCYGRSMTAGEIACFLSHQKAISEFLKTDLDYCFIVEDDVLFSDSFWNSLHTIVRFVQNNPEKNLLINFCLPTNNKGINVCDNNMLKIHHFFYSTPGAFCYLIKRGAAQEIVKQKPVAPYDKILQRPWVYNSLHLSMVGIVSVLPNIPSSICENGQITRNDAKISYIKQYGIIKYKMNRVIASVIKFEIPNLIFSINKLGFWKTIKILLT